MAAIQRHAVAPVPPVPLLVAPPPRLPHTRPPNPSWHLPATLLAGVLLPRQSQRLWRLWRLARGVSRCPECWQPQPVPQMSHLDFLRQLRQGEPVVLRDPGGADLVEKYNFEYLESQMKGSDWRVHLVPKGQRFQRVYGQGVGEGMVTTMSFPDFAGKSLSDAAHAYYMQVPFSGRPLESLGTDPYGSDMRDDRRRVLQWLRKLTEEAELGELDNNQLWIGRGGNLTPCHYDKAENLHLQICGRKTFLLIPPDQTFAVYPYPIDHPLDSFSMVDFDSPDFQRFDDFADVQAFQVTLEPGDLLYLPKYWWHQVAQGSGDNVSLNFWCAERQADQMSIFQETSPRCRPLLAHRFLEDFTGGIVRRLHAAKALPSSFTAARLLSELGSGWAEDTPEGLRRLGSMVRGRLAELMGDLSEEELDELLRGTCAGDRLVECPATEVTTASQGDLGGWFADENGRTGDPESRLPRSKAAWQIVERHCLADGCGCFCWNHYSSCTGVMTLWTGTILTVAHVGDSRATLGYVEDGLVGYEQLTSDHKPDLPDERRRIEEAGGIVALRNQAAFLRGGDFEERKARGETPKGLQYSRAFGGKDLKPYGLSSVPDVKQVTLEAKHKVLIVASDGLWDVCPSERAVHVALDAADRHLDPAQALVQHALAENRCLQRKADNVTVLVVLFSEGLN